MHILNSSSDLLANVALAADICLKPWKHSVLNKVNSSEQVDSQDVLIDLTLSIQCRNIEGERLPENDLELEIFRSGSDLSITVSWESFPDRPILWHGKRSLWMDSKTGKQCSSPTQGPCLEALARRLRSTLVLEEIN